MTGGPTEPDDAAAIPDRVEDVADIDDPADTDRAADTDGTADASVADTVEADNATYGHVTAAAAAPGDLLEREGEVAADYLEGLLDIIDADGDIDMDVEGDRAVVSVIGDRLRHLVGPRGAVLDALQDLTRLAVAQDTGVRSRLLLDIGGYRARRRAELTEIGTQAAQRAAQTGAPVTLDPMTAFERKVVHDAVAAAGQNSESEGVEPQRRVVVLPASGTAFDDADDVDDGDAADAPEPAAGHVFDDSAARESTSPNL
jgi:spoIIIJ-associated protein